jgi:hypothetical protein
LSDGTNTYILPSSSGTLALTTQINTTTESNFGTATTTNPVKVGNTAGQSIGLELHFNVLKLINTSGVQIATFTPVSNTCDLDLNGGLLKTFTASTNAVWQGTTIASNYGGTGLSSLSGQATKVLQVNSGENGYTFATLPTVITNNNQLVNGAGFITASSTNTLTNKSISYSQITGTPTVITNNNQLVNGAGYITTSDWTFVSSTDTLHPLSSANTNVSLGTNSNPNTRRLLVSGIAEFDSTFVDEILVGTTSNPNSRKLYVDGTAEINSTLHTDSIELKNTNTSYNLEMRDDRIRNKSYVLNAHIFQTITGLSYPIHILQSGTSTSTKTFNILLANQDSEWDGGGYANNTKFPLLGNDDGNFFLHLNTIGDAYQISGTNSSNLQHLFLGKTVINKELVTNVDNASSNGRIGFQNFLAGYPNNIFPTLIAEQTYGYFMSATTPISGTGGSYDGYWGNGAIGNASDRRLKKNINTIENPIDIIKKLRGVNFEWICENKPKGTQIGYIAQEVNEVIPSICDFLPTKNECCEDGTWGIQPANISAILVEGIKAQQEEINTQQEQINTLTTELDTYKSLMDKLINAKSFADFKKNIA